jgi:hypothetical protein
VFALTHFEYSHARHTTITSTTFNDYVTTLPTWEQDIFLPVRETPSSISLYEVLTPKHITLMAVSDGGADAPKHYGSFGWVLDTDQKILWECKGIVRGFPMKFYSAAGYGRLSLLSFLAHYQSLTTYAHHFLLRQLQSAQKRGSLSHSRY